RHIVLAEILSLSLHAALPISLVSHMGYMLFGIGMTTQMGMAATIYYVAHHITVQSTLFLAAGLIEHRGGTTNLIKLGGQEQGGLDRKSTRLNSSHVSTSSAVF